MFTSDKSSAKIAKTVLIYTIISASCFAVNKIYSVFGHGVASSYMTYMFLFPLIGGAAVFLALWALKARTYELSKFRLLFNLYNSGLAALVLGSMLKGVFEIAGTASDYTKLYFIAGAIMIITAAAGYLISLREHNEKDSIFE